MRFVKSSKSSALSSNLIVKAQICESSGKRCQPTLMFSQLISSHTVNGPNIHDGLGTFVLRSTMYLKLKKVLWKTSFEQKRL